MALPRRLIGTLLPGGAIAKGVGALGEAASGVPVIGRILGNGAVRGERRAQLSARDLPPETIRTSVRAWLTRAATGDRTPETLADSKKLAVGVAFDTMCPNLARRRAH